MDKKLTKQNYIKEENKEKIVLALWQENRYSMLFLLRQFILDNVLEMAPGLKTQININDVKLEHPSQENFGDYSANIVLMIAGRLKQSPRVLAEKISHKINKTLKKSREDKRNRGDKYREKIAEILEKVEVAGGGFLNLWLQKDYFGTELAEVLTKNVGDRLTQMMKDFVGLGLWDKKIMVEFAHPNTHKEFHIGHLRNISLGESVVRILEANGAKVYRANYEGDVGLHVAKAIWGVRQKLKTQNSKLKSEKELIINKEKLEEIRKLNPVEKAKFLGEAYALGSKAYEENEEAKKEIIEVNKAIYKDPKKVELWEETRGWSLEYFDWIYKRLGTYFDRLFFESEVEKPGRQVVIDNVKRGIFIKDKDGSVYFPGSNYGFNDCVFVTRENYATYEGKDVALEALEYEVFPFDLDIHNVANEQKNFFQIAFKALETVFPYQKNRQFHLAYGMVNLKGAKLSSRTGDVVTADRLIDEAKKKIKEIMAKSFKAPQNTYPSRQSKLNQVEIEAIAEKVAVGAVKYSMLRVNPKMDIAFDLGESVSFEGDSGPYLQYTYARCKSVIRRSKTKDPASLAGGQRSKREEESIVYHNTIIVYHNISDDEISLMRAFHRFPEVIVDAGRALSPNLICNYLFNLAQKYNLFYNKYSILNPMVKLSNGSMVKKDSKQEFQQFSNLAMKQSVSDFRLALTEATANILQKGLELLGIDTVERM